MSLCFSKKKKSGLSDGKIFIFLSFLKCYSLNRNDEIVFIQGKWNRRIVCIILTFAPQRGELVSNPILIHHHFCSPVSIMSWSSPHRVQVLV